MQPRKRENQIATRRENGTLRVQSVNTEPSMTQQQFIQDCDVNYIMEKFLKTGTITHTRAAPGAYLDLVDQPDYEQSYLAVARANSAFMELDADIRLKFNNNPSEFIRYLADETKVDEQIQLGLRVPKEQDPVINHLETISKNTHKEPIKKTAKKPE